MTYMCEQEEVDDDDDDDDFCAPHLLWYAHAAALDEGE